jgi:Flp pilus assembly protein TadD
MAVGLGDLDLARRLAAKTVASRPLDSHALVVLAALEAEHEGLNELAAERFAEAASRWRAFGAPYEEAHARLGEGRCLAALGRGDDASAPLRRAARVFRRLGADPALSQALRVLESSDLRRV